MARCRNPNRVATAPTPKMFEGYANLALASIPPQFRQHVRNVAIRVEDFASDEVLDELGKDSPFGLLGLYSGIPRPWQSVTHVRQQVDTIYLYRRPILEYWYTSKDDLFTIVRHVLVHEIGHHFGFSDEDMKLIEQG